MTKKDEPDRRQYGSGSVYQRKSDNRWIGTIQAGWTAKGTRRRIVVSGKTKKQAQDKLEAKQRQIIRDGLPTHGKRLTVHAWSQEWLKITAAHLRPGTWVANRSAVNKWMIPTIGHRNLDQLSLGDMRAVAKAQTDAGRSTSTAHRTHRVMIRMLKDALLEGYDVPQRILIMKAPTPAVSNRTALDVEQAINLLGRISHEPDGSRWVAALLQGMRQGECLGLTWEAVDLENLTIQVSWQLQRLPYLDRKADTFRMPEGFEARRLSGAAHLVRPKSKKGWRVIPIVYPMEAALRGWRDVAPHNDYDLVWPDADGQPRVAEEDRQAWKDLQAAVGISHPSGRPYHPHEARHTAATLLLEAGVDPEVIKAILGHSSIVTSQGYMHANQTMARQAIEKMATRLKMPAAPDRRALPPAPAREQ